MDKNKEWLRDVSHQLSLIPEDLIFTFYNEGQEIVRVSSTFEI